jgi:hypothetical protein
MVTEERREKNAPRLLQAFEPPYLTISNPRKERSFFARQILFRFLKEITLLLLVE